MSAYNEALKLADLVDEVGEVPCMNVPDLFFPESVKTDTNWISVDAAKKLCQGCPIKFECAQYALDNFEIHGVWGGLSANDRKKLWKKKGINYVENTE